MARKPTNAVAVKEAESNKAVGPLSGGGGKKNFGNIDTTRDIIIPRIKLIQKISPELETHDNAVDGEFWHTIAEQSLGAELRAVPLLTNVSVVLWAPRGDERRILARSSDRQNWDVGGNTVFEVKPKGAPKQQWDTKGSVRESGLLEFGSSIEGDPNSQPAAAETFSFMWWLLDYPQFSPAIIINTRSSVKPAKSLISKVMQRDGQQYEQVYKIEPFLDGGGDQPYYNYKYTADGYVDDEELQAHIKALFENFSASANWKVNDEEQEHAPENGGSGGGKPKGDTTGRKGKF